MKAARVSQRWLGSGLTFEHLKSQMSEYLTLPHLIVANGFKAKKNRAAVARTGARQR
jgi:hypothetical protein